jgi:AcrR family transcriptional regulator
MALKASLHPKTELPAHGRENGAAQRIVTAARRHFFTHGFRGVTMDDLAEELGMSKKTLYLSFSSKSDLLRAVLLDKFHHVEADLEEITSRFPADALVALQQLLACMRRHTEEIQPPFVRDIRREAPEMFKLVESRRRDLIQRHFGKFFSKGRRAGIIRRDISTKVIIEVLLGATEAVMNPQKISELGLTPQTGYAAIISIILEGVITGRGRSKA